MFTVEIKGLRELQAKIEKMPVTLKTEVNGILQRGAQVFVRNAQRDAPVNFGRLSQSITYFPNPVKNLQVELVAGIEYAPYIEWGTITRVSVPAEQAPYAITFKGRGLRKTGGIFPRPFFFKQLPAAKATIEQGIQAILRDEKL